MNDIAEPVLVFVVDDDDDTRELLCDLLADAAYAVVGFADAAAALAAARDRLPAAIVTDLTLPGMSGEELAASVRRDFGARVLLFATTGREVAASAAGLFDRVLKKPFDVDDVLSTVAAALDSMR